MEYAPPRRRARLIIIVGIVLALGAGGSAFMLLKQAETDQSRANTPKVAIVVASRVIPARKTIEVGDVAVHEVSTDSIPPGSEITDPNLVVGRVVAVTILAGQPLSMNLFASSTGTGTIAVLGPDETVTANSPIWRAVSINVPDDRALGGLLEAGQTVDVFVTLPVQIPAGLAASQVESADGTNYYGDRSTKILYQGVPIIARSASYYIVRVTQQVAEEVAHLEASGAAAFSFALRPDVDNRITNVAGLGETTNLIIQRYSLPVPEEYPTEDSKVTNPVPGKPSTLPYIAASSTTP